MSSSGLVPGPFSKRVAKEYFTKENRAVATYTRKATAATEDKGKKTQEKKS